MAEGDPARGGKGHVTGPCLDTNVSSMTACTWRSSSVESTVDDQEETDKEERNRNYSPKQMKLLKVEREA